MENKPGNENQNEKGKNNAAEGKNDIFTEQDLMRFISRIIGCGIEKNIRIALSELSEILRNEGVDYSMLTLLHDTILASQELAEFGETNNNSDITEDELGKAIRKSRERIRREESFRC